MPTSPNELPEGTDSVILGAADAGMPVDERSGGGFGATYANEGETSAAAGKLGDAAAKVSDATSSLRAQATDKVYGIAAQGKDRALGVLDNVTQLVEDAARQIDEKAGERYGDYARQASHAVAGLADNLRERDVDDLVDDARELVRKSPAVAIGAAAAVGFLLARILKVGLSQETNTGTVPSQNRSYAARAHSAPTPTTATTVPVDAGY